VKTIIGIALGGALAYFAARQYSNTAADPSAIPGYAAIGAGALAYFMLKNPVAKGAGIGVAAIGAYYTFNNVNSAS
jgi:hypothetical protein